MRIIQNTTFDGERALYGSKGIVVKDRSFHGPADGESAFKECADVQVEHAFFNLRYPFRHNHGLKISGSEMTELCRAALWYSDHIEITDTKLRGIKALRACSKVSMRGCDIVSPEFGWSVRDIEMEDCCAESEYSMMRSANLHFRHVRMEGKYSFRYITSVLSIKNPLSGRIIAPAVGEIIRDIPGAEGKIVVMEDPKKQAVKTCVCA